MQLASIHVRQLHTVVADKWRENCPCRDIRLVSAAKILKADVAFVLRIAVSVLVLVDGFCQLHVLVHENDGEDLPGFVCLVALCLVKVQA